MKGLIARAKEMDMILAFDCYGLREGEPVCFGRKYALVVDASGQVGIIPRCLCYVGLHVISGDANDSDYGELFPLIVKFNHEPFIVNSRKAQPFLVRGVELGPFCFYDQDQWTFNLLYGWEDAGEVDNVSIAVLGWDWQEIDPDDVFEPHDEIILKGILDGHEKAEIIPSPWVPPALRRKGKDDPDEDADQPDGFDFSTVLGSAPVAPARQPEVDETEEVDVLDLGIDERDVKEWWNDLKEDVGFEGFDVGDLEDVFKDDEHAIDLEPRVEDSSGLDASDNLTAFFRAVPKVSAKTWRRSLPYMFDCPHIVCLPACRTYRQTVRTNAAPFIGHLRTRHASSWASSRLWKTT